MSEAVERRLIEVLGHPTESPYGTPIPGLDELGETTMSEDFRSGVVPLDRVDVSGGSTTVRVRRISEPAQKQPATMSALRRVGAMPGQVVTVSESPNGVRIDGGDETTEFDLVTVSHIFVNSV